MSDVEHVLAMIDGALEDYSLGTVDAMRWSPAPPAPAPRSGVHPSALAEMYERELECLAQVQALWQAEIAAMLERMRAAAQAFDRVTRHAMRPPDRLGMDPHGLTLDGPARLSRMVGVEEPAGELRPDERTADPRWERALRQARCRGSGPDRQLQRAHRPRRLP